MHLVAMGNALLEDWLVTEIKVPAVVAEVEGGLLKLTNGIVTRTFLTRPGFATVDLYSHEKNSSVLRALDPEVTSFFITSANGILAE